MARCQFCREDIKPWDIKKKGHLIVTLDVQDKVHVHGDLNNEAMMEDLINRAIAECDLGHKFPVEYDIDIAGTNKSATKDIPKEIVFRNRQRIGDSLMFTSGIRDFAKAFPNTRINVVSTAMHIWDNNPYVDPTLVPTEENTIKIGPGKLTNASNRLDWHFANAYRVSIEDNLKVSIPQGPPSPDIWLTQEEWNAPPITSDPYWIIVIGGEKGWGCKMYPFNKWQTFITQNPDTLFYQIGTKEDDHPRLQGDNIVDYIGKTQDKNTGIRDLFKLFLNAEGSIGLVSFHMHLSAALGKPCIVVAGAREPVSFTRYPGHQYLATDGCSPCSDNRACWHCNIDTCESLVVDEAKELELDRKVPGCVNIIFPEDITNALNKYYLGGRLNKSIQSSKPSRFKNIAKEGKIHQVKNVAIKNPPRDSGVGLPFDAGSITEKDWEFMESVIDTYNPSTMLEFGAGLSTLLLNKKGLKVTTYEVMQGWVKKVRDTNPNCVIRLWDGKKIEESLPMFDVAFVDGPSGAQNREWSTKLAVEHADIIIIHDAGRENERRWQFRYLKEGFRFVARGGNRCHLWVRNKKYEEAQEKFKCFSKPQQVHIDRIVDTPIPKPAEVDITKPVKVTMKTAEMDRLKPKVTITPSQLQTYGLKSKKYIKFVFNGRGEGGAERSITWMINTLKEMGHTVSYHTPNPRACGTFRKTGNRSVPIETMDSMRESCDIMVLYTNDWIWEFSKPEVCEIFESVNAGRKVMCVNYKIGEIGKALWTKGWDKYLFLNSELESELAKRAPDSNTMVMAPPTILDDYFDIKPDYNTGLKLIRHSSQGNAKYPANFSDIVEKIMALRRDATLRLMPAPDPIKDIERVTKHPRNSPPIKEYLALGNCFWYHLPFNYTEGGPKVIMEAQAAGLPVITDNNSGMKDRVVAGTGWLCNSTEEHCSVMGSVTLDELRICGENAREHARSAYNPTNWLTQILGDA